MAQGSVFRRNKTWTYRIRDSRGGHPSKGGFRTKREAEEALAVVRHELATGQHVRRSRMTVDEYLTGWLPTQNRRLAPSTVKSYRTAVARIDRRIGDVPLQKLSPEEVEQRRCRTRVSIRARTFATTACLTPLLRSMLRAP